MWNLIELEGERLMKKQRQVFGGIVVAILVFIVVMFLLEVKPWEKPISERIFFDWNPSESAEFDWNQKVFLISEGEKHADNLDMTLNFITYIPNQEELQFGYKISRLKNREKFNYFFRLRSDREEITADFTTIPRTEKIYSYYRIKMPLELTNVDHLYLDIYNKDNELLDSVFLIESADDLRQIDYDYNNGSYNFVSEENEDDEILSAKPVIYLYPNEKTNISVDLEFDGILTCTYPSYNNGWNVIASPNGDLINTQDNKEYSYLYWEGESVYNWQIEEGFVVKGENTVEFLQEKLAYMGLTPHEYNEFIVYWLPKMKSNKYNLIYFAGDEYLEMAKLKVYPKPQSIQRIYMVFKGLNEYIDIQEQELKPFERQGYTLIEWGGAELK